MKREEFVERNQKLLDQIEAIECEILNLESEYIHSQVKIPVGSKIIISTPVKYLDKEGNIIRESLKTREAYLVGFHVYPGGRIEPLAKKVRKDGSMSSVRGFVLPHETISLAEEFNNQQKQ